jgi:[NiFe] hydrogenase diaphorase moiety large subunit
LCDATEYEVGAFKVRALLENSKDALLDGLIMATGLVGAVKIIIVVSSDYPVLYEELSDLIKERQELGMMTGRFAGKEVALQFEVRLDLTGSSNDQDLRGAAEGLADPKDGASNVLQQKAEFFVALAQGMAQPKQENWSSVLLSVSGDVQKSGVYEMEEGSSLEELLTRCLPNPDCKAVLLGGRLISAKDISSVRVTADEIFGSGSIIVFNIHRSMSAVVCNILAEVLSFLSEDSAEVEQLDEIYIALHELLKQPDEELLQAVLAKVKEIKSRDSLVSNVVAMMESAFENFPEDFGGSHK